MADEKFYREAVTAAQNAFHDEAHDYDPSSPHLRHSQIRNGVIRDLTILVKESIAERGECRVMEIGAGHGTFTETLLAAGARVTVTETSDASASSLTQRYSEDERVKVFHDATGDETLALPGEFDLVVCVSVLHHIPDYTAFVDAIVSKLRKGGAFYSVQDPLWYARMSPLAHRLHFAAYFAWRLLQGNIAQGIATRIRRLRGVYDASPSDLVEYHVVREGVDEEVLRSSLARQFVSVRLFTYWSTQMPLLQKLGEKTRIRTNFGIIGRDFHSISTRPASIFPNGNIPNENREQMKDH